MLRLEKLKTFELIGEVEDDNLFYYNKKNKIMVRTDFSNVQYVLYNNTFYHGDDFFEEPKELLGKYETIHVVIK